MADFLSQCNSQLKAVRNNSNYISATISVDKNNTERLSWEPSWTTQNQSKRKNTEVEISTKKLLRIAKHVSRWHMGKHATFRENILRNDQWLEIYQVADNRTLRYIFGETEELKTPKTVSLTHGSKTMPCHNCGLVLPLDLIQIDHAKAVGKSTGPDEAVIKVFRYLGLTDAAATGGKYKALFDNDYDVVPTKAVSGRQPILKANYTSDKDSSLTEEGKLIKDAFKVLRVYESLKDACLYSVVNLQPLCPTCNNYKKNK